MSQTLLLISIKNKDPKRYESLCRKLARKGPEKLELRTVVKDGGTTYRLSKASIRDVYSHRESEGPRFRRGKYLGTRILGGICFGAFIVLFLVIAVWSAPIVTAAESYIRMLGGSILFTASIIFLRDSAKGGLSKMVRWNNPALWVAVGAGMVFLVDWAPDFGTTLIPDAKDLFAGPGGR